MTGKSLTKRNVTPAEFLRRMTMRVFAGAMLPLCLALLSACALVEAPVKLVESTVGAANTLGKLATGGLQREKTRIRILEEGTAPDIRKALDEGMDVNAVMRDGLTPLMLAAAKNPHPEAITSLLAAGADPSIRTEPGYSAFFFAVAKNPSLDVTRILLEAGSELDVENIKGATPLIAAMMNPNPEIARFLIASGANVNHRSEEGYTPLMAACRYSKPEYVKLLLESGAEVNAVQARGTTALMFAAEGSPYPEIIGMLAAAGANAATVNMDGKNALAFAGERKVANPDIEAALLRAGARPL